MYALDRRVVDAVEQHASALNQMVPIQSTFGRFAKGRLCVESSASVVLTRQAGSNNKARSLLISKGVRTIELPLIEFKLRPEAGYLREILTRKKFDWVALTSPQAARVFVDAWKAATSPPIRIATFDGTKKELTNCSPKLEVGFVPGISNAENLAKELPKEESQCNEVLYPASSKADDTFEKALRSRSFVVTRLDTYETSTVAKETIDKADLEHALDADVLTFASPTAVRAWMEITGHKCNFQTPIACIGSTTAKRARALGFENVYFSEKPGLDGLVQSVVSILIQNGKLMLERA